MNPSPPPPSSSDPTTSVEGVAAVPAAPLAAARPAPAAAGLAPVIGATVNPASVATMTPATEVSPASVAGTPGSAPTPAPVPAPTGQRRASPRIAKRKLTAEVLAEARRKKTKLVVDNDAATTRSALASAVALGASRSAATNPLRRRPAATTQHNPPATSTVAAPRTARKATKTRAGPAVTPASVPSTAPVTALITSTAGSTASAPAVGNPHGEQRGGTIPLDDATTPQLVQQVTPATLPPSPEGLATPTRVPASVTTRSDFDLDTFLRTFHAGAPPVVRLWPAPILNTTLYGVGGGNVRSRAPITAIYPGPQPQIADPSEFLQFLQTQPDPTAIENASAGHGPESWTLPNTRGSLPPPTVRNLRADQFPPPANRGRGDFAPAAVHNLAAHRLYHHLLSPEGVHETPTASVLRLRMLDCLNFLDTPPIIAAVHGARFGRYGVSIMHFHRADGATQLAAGSSDANFNLDFDPKVAPPTAPACDSYFDLLGAIQGLTSFANSEWHEVLARPLYRIREFVMANAAADKHQSPQRVQRTLYEVNQHLGAVYVHLSSDSPYWWRDFSTAAAKIDFNSIAWSTALHGLANCPTASPSPRAETSTFNRTTSGPRHVRRDDTEREQQPRPNGIPANLRAIIPRAVYGTEPCLRFFGGGMCFGGTKEKCAAAGRTHTWPRDLPAALMSFITKKFGPRRGPARRRA